MKNEKYEEYLELFKDDIEGLKNDLAKTESYQRIIDNKLDELGKNSGVRGGEHYLVEQVKNAIAVEGQKLNIRKHIVDVKKMALDYAMKDKNAEGADIQNLNEAINKLLAEHEDEVLTALDDKLDDEIEQMMEEMNKNGEM